MEGEADTYSYYVCGHQHLLNNLFIFEEVVKL